MDVIANGHLKVSALDLYTNFVSEYEIKINKLSLMEVIIKAVNDIQDVKAAHEFLEKFKPKVRYKFYHKSSSSIFHYKHGSLTIK